MTGRDRATGTAATGAGVDVGVGVGVGEATTRCPPYGLLPSWFVPGVADRAMRRRTRIEDTAGTRESLIPSLMRAEIGVPIAFTPRHEVDPLLLTAQPAGAAVHETTALRDVRTAVRSEREVKPVEPAPPRLPGVAAVRGAGVADVPARRPGEVPGAGRARRPGRVAAGAAPAPAVAHLLRGHRRRDRHVCAPALRRGAAALPTDGQG